MFAADELRPRMTELTRAICAGRAPFEGLVPEELDRILADLAPQIGRSTLELREVYFTSIHGFFERTPEEMAQIRMQLGALQGEVTRRMRGPGPAAPYRPDAAQMAAAVEAGLAAEPGLVLVDSVTDRTQAFFRIGRQGGGALEVTLTTLLGRPGAYTQDVLGCAGQGRGLNCLLRPLFGDFRDGVFASPEAVTGCTARILRKAAAVLDWWEGAGG